MILKRSLPIICCLALLLSLRAEAIELADHPKVKAVADRLVDAGHYSQNELDEIFSAAKVQQNVLDAMMNPAEYKFTWGKYRKLFLKQDRIDQGVEFWQTHHSLLERAEREYGVPAEVIVAIIGVESKFGKFKGKYRVLDSLVSLVTGFPRRSKFFAGELEEFLILTKENNLDATEILGSYAGAVGYPQFISSSYRNYAVDFNGDGSTDLIDQVEDAIGSIANYFIENGWKPGQPVTSQPVSTVAQDVAELASRKRKVKHTAADLRARGAKLSANIKDDEKLGVLMMDASEIVRDESSADKYIVRAGDTVCQIAERLKVSCKALIKRNGINNRGDIFRGQSLALPAQRSGKPKSVNKPSTKMAAMNDTGQRKLIQSKDSKWQVAASNEKDVKVGSVSKSKLERVQKTDRVTNAKHGSNEKELGPKPVYFYTHHNFYAITQYNHSVLYAMAVHDLSQAIAGQRKSALAAVSQ